MLNDNNLSEAIEDVPVLLTQRTQAPNNRSGLLQSWHVRVLEISRL